MLDDVVLPSGLHVYRRGDEAVDTWIVFSYGGVSGLGEQGPQPVYDAYVCSIPSVARSLSFLFTLTVRKCACWPKGAACGGNGAEVVLFFRGFPACRPWPRLASMDWDS
ncbi:unnamed protein product [Ectocarpus sp. 8 AP-2014]